MLPDLTSSAAQCVSARNQFKRLGRGTPCTPIAAIPARNSPGPTSARPSGSRAGSIGCAIMAACCSSTCATTTASPRCWPTATARPSPRSTRCAPNGSIRIEGTVKARDDSLVNPKLPTGEIEVYIGALDVLGAAEELPLPVFGDQDYPEETRLAYRFLDLRRESLHQNIMLRSNVVRSMRNRMWDTGFTEFQTPIITASTPEGARDFLVPSRLHPGKFYALPQAPQQFKQLIMVAGFDRYFQIAPCFRDEDPRADRSPDRLLPARRRDELRRAGGRVQRGPAGDPGRVRGIRRRPGGRPPLAADQLRRCREVVRHRQARPAQPDQDAGRVRAFRAARASPSSPSSWRHEGNEIRAIPAPKGPAASRLAASSATA